MKKTILLCFIHGFKGDDNTFGQFPSHVRALLSHALPKVEVQAITYPTFETRGDLTECVSRFRDWLLEKVIDLEVANGTPSPTVDPSVHTILIGHSMGGIVAADTLLSIATDVPLDADGKEGHLSESMFPYIAGVLAFDTPYLGISPGVVAHGAEGHYNKANEAFTTLSGLAGAFWGGKAASDASASSESSKKEKPVAALPAPEAAKATGVGWGKISMFAGAAAAVAAGGGLAYMKRDQITEGWTWVGSHLEFVGCLMKGEELRKRVAGVVRCNKEIGVGWANLYTRLGKQAVSKETGSMVGSVIGNQRTFCNLPKERGEVRSFWKEAINDAASDEVLAHMYMFSPKDNPGYYALSEAAKEVLVEWSTNEWYESSTGKATAIGLEEHEEL